MYTLKIEHLPSFLSLESVQAGATDTRTCPTLEWLSDKSIKAQFESLQEAERFYAIVNGMGIAGHKVSVTFMDPPLFFVETADPLVFKHIKLGTTSYELYCYARRFGRLTLVKSMLDRNGHESFGIVQFERQEHALQCKTELNQTVWFGHSIQVSFLQKSLPWYDSYWKTAKVFPATTGWHSRLDTTNLYVKNLPLNWTESDLSQLFAPCGTIVSLRIMMNQDAHSKGFGFVKFATEEEALKALGFNGQLIQGKPLHISVAEPKRF